jgi:hypothetical protein
LLFSTFVLSTFSGTFEISLEPLFVSPIIIYPAFAPIK